MELRHLTYFREVARREHISDAARDLNVSQPAVTKQLQDLERELGVALFERNGRRIKLTVAGQLLLHHAEIILGQVNLARHELDSFSAHVGGRVRIGAPPTVGERLLPSALHRFHQIYPRVELKVFEGATSALTRQLDSGELDLAVVSLPLSYASIATDELFTEELVVVVAEQHPLAGREGVHIAELRDEPFLLYSPGGYVREATVTACRSVGFSPRVALDSGSMELLLRLAEAGLGVAVVPQLALTGREQLWDLRILDQQLTRTVGLATSRQRPLSKAAAKLREQLQQELPEAWRGALAQWALRRERGRQSA
jgi:LysR family transcriptional regulator, transcription activator of glutamate synthase operon